MKSDCNGMSKIGGKFSDCSDLGCLGSELGLELKLMEIIADDDPMTS